MNFDSESLWSSSNNNTFKGEGLYINAEDEDFSLGGDFYYDNSEDQLGLDGQLLMDEDGSITNENNDYVIDEDGISLNPSSSFSPETSITWGTDLGIGAWEGTAADRLEYRSEMHSFSDGTNIALTIQPSGFGNSRITLNGSIVYMDELPTSEPSESNRVWNDNGNLRISQ